MTKRNRDLAQRGTGAVTAGSGQASGPARPVTPARFGTVVHRVVPAQLACRIGARARAGESNAWPAVAAIALGSFALVFSELIPVGLLADISGHLGVSVGTGGLMVVVPAVAAAVAAPLLALCSARLERRAVLAGLSALVLVSDVIAGAAARGGHRRAPADYRAGGRLGPGVRGGAGGRAELDGPGDASRPRRRPGPVRLALQGSLAAGAAVGGIVYDAEGPGGALIVAAVFAALGALTLLGRAGAAISAAPAPAVKTVPADRTQHSGRGGPAGAVARRD